jgi:hypothetical protein
VGCRELWTASYLAVCTQVFVLTLDVACIRPPPYYDQDVQTSFLSLCAPSLRVGTDALTVAENQIGEGELADRHALVGHTVREMDVGEHHAALQLERLVP